MDTITDKQSEAPQIKAAFKLSEPEQAPITVAENRIFILSNDKRQGKVILDVEEDVIDPKTGKPRRMRLLRGAQSLWFDEQPPSVYPEKYINKNILNLEFDGGICIIPINNPFMTMAAELTNSNVATKKLNGSMAKHRRFYFYEWNPEEMSRKSMDEENDVIKAMQLAMTIPIEELIPHAAYLNIPFMDEQGVQLGNNALRTAYIRKAKNDAKRFLDSIHSPTVKIAHMVRNAVNSSKIDLGKQRGAAYWADGGFICTLPEGKDEVDYLIEFAMVHGDANTAFANQLRELV